MMYTLMWFDWDWQQGVIVDGRGERRFISPRKVVGLDRASNGMPCTYDDGILRMGVAPEVVI